MASPRSHVRPEPAELEDARRRRNHRRQLRRRHADATRQLIAQDGRDRARAHARRRDAVFLAFEPGVALLVRAIRKPNTGTILVPDYTGVAVKSRAGRVLVHRDPPAKRATRRKYAKRLRDRGLAWVSIGRTRPVDESRVHEIQELYRPQSLNYPESIAAAERISDDYERDKAEYDRRFLAWRESGEVGNPPPHPVRPHIPGFLPPVDVDEDA